MFIRKATLEDSEAMAQLFMMVMDGMVYRFLGKDNFEDGINFFIRFIEQVENQYSYQNCFVAVDRDEVVGVINTYDGELLQKLRQPILNFIHKHNNPEFVIEDETQMGEIYIDMIAVSAKHQGKGIGSQLLNYSVQEFCVEQHRTLGLLVDKKNHKAKQLYLKCGFKKVNEKIFCGHKMEHLQLKI